MNRRLNLSALLCLLVSIETQVSGAEKLTTIMAMSDKGENVRTVVVLDDFPSIGSPEVSRDGKKIAFDGWHANQELGSSQLFIFHLETSEIQHLGEGSMPSWSADGKFLAYCGLSPRGISFRTAEGVSKKLIDSNGWGVQWSPDGQKLAYANRGDFVIYDLLKDESRTIQPNPQSPYTYIYFNFGWSPDSTKLCFRGTRPDGKYETAIVDVTQAEPELTVCFEYPGGYGSEFSWHPSGESIVVVKYTKPSRLYEFKPQADVIPEEFPGQTGELNHVGSCWSPNGKTLYFLTRTK